MDDISAAIEDHVNDIHHSYKIIFCFTTFVTRNHGIGGIVMPKEVFVNDS